jgi:hypothetical protein
MRMNTIKGEIPADIANLASVNIVDFERGQRILGKAPAERTFIIGELNNRDGRVWPKPVSNELLNTFSASKQLLLLRTFLSLLQIASVSYKSMMSWIDLSPNLKSLQTPSDKGAVAFKLSFAAINVR